MAHPGDRRKGEIGPGSEGSVWELLFHRMVFGCLSRRASRAPGLSYRVRSDGTARCPSTVLRLRCARVGGRQRSAGIAMDRDGRAYVATRMGVQVFDRNGRVAAILPLPGNARGDQPLFRRPRFRYAVRRSGRESVSQKASCAGSTALGRSCEASALGRRVVDSNDPPRDSV